MYKVVLFCLAWLAATAAPAAVLFSTNATWRYLPGRAEASTPDPAAWRAPAFDDSSWSNGPAPFYYGEPLNGTLLSDMLNQYLCVFLRRSFVVTNLAELGGLRLGAKCDDGFIAWINGVEVQRYNVRSGVVPYNTTATASVTEPISFVFSNVPNWASCLAVGTNVISVQVFNSSLGSSDLVIDLSLESTAPDHTAPGVARVSPAAGVVGNLTQIEVVFTEPVGGVRVNDLLVNGLAPAAMTGGNDTYTFSFPQPAYGSVRITWSPLQQITDLATPPNAFDGSESASSWQYDLVDRTPPTVTLLSPPAGATVRSLSGLDVIFSEGVTGVEAGDLRINGRPATNLVVWSDTHYHFDFPAPATGRVQFAWAADHGIRDLSVPSNPFPDGSWDCTLDPNAITTGVRINEFLAANNTGLKDEDGEIQDWIELYNDSTNPVSLAGWTLTDDSEDPNRWTFPVLTLGPRQFLTVFTSGKDRREVGGTNRLHTNFKLSPLGEYLALLNADSPRQAMSEFAPAYPEQRNDYSYGCDRTGQWRYFATPTPGASNGVSSVIGVVATPHCSAPAGFFAGSFTLYLSTATPGATIRYTTNGSPPTETTGWLYSNALVVSRSTILRAAAFLTNQLPSTVLSRTFLFPDNVPAQTASPAGFPSTWGSVAADYEVDPNVATNALYSAGFKQALQSLPTLSIVMDATHLFGASGLYANPGSSGLAWERPGSVEWISPDGDAGFQVNCGVRIQGGVGRSTSVPKHSFRFLFKGDYGPSKLDYPFFAGSPVRQFDTLILRAGFNNSYVWSASEAQRATYLQDNWIRDAYRAMGNVSEYGNFVHLYLNGLYWGVYNAVERPSAPYAATWLGGDKAEWDALNSSEAVDGTKTAWNTLHTLANAGLTNEAAYQAIQQYLDVTNLVDYMLVNFFGGNQDWDDHNWYAARRRQPGAGYRFFCWDAERTLEDVNADRTAINQADKPSRLYAQLRTYPEFRVLFGDRAQRHLFNTGALTPEACAARFALLTNQLYQAIVCESARWGDTRREPPFTRNAEWQTEVNRLFTSYFPARTAKVLAQLRAANLYPTVEAPTFNQHGGQVARGFALTLSAPAGTVYYTLTGEDPRIYLSGSVSAQAVAYTAPLAVVQAVTIKARALSGGQWSALTEATFQLGAPGTPWRITEIMYNPPGGDTFEFLELQNTGLVPLDLGGCSFAGLTFTFPPNSLVGPGTRLVLAPSANPSAWAARYPGITPAGYYEGALANGGERIALLDPRGQVLVSVEYDDENGWPTEPDGRGRSLELLDPSGDPHAPANWRASSADLGTPGAPNSTPPFTSVWLNEIMADNFAAVTNAGFCPDWIELANRTGAPTDLSNWSLSDGDNPRQFVFPAGTSLPAGGFLVVWCDDDLAAPGLHTGFALGRDGESLFLWDAATNRVDAVTFGPQVRDYSLGRVGTGWVLTQPTPGRANLAAAVAASSSLAINEWLANSPAGGDDWIELYNRDPNRPASLRGLALATLEATCSLSSLSFLPAGGFGLLKADHQGRPGHLDFKLPADGGSLRLYDETGGLVDRVDYGPQTEGVSRGRWPDGGAALTNFPGGATPGSANRLAGYTGPLLNEVMAHNLSAVQDSGGRVADWVEVYNPGAAPCDLGGMSLSLDGVQPGQWKFPASTVLAPGGYRVIWCDGSRAASTNLEPDLNCGHALKAEGGGVCLFNASGQLADSVEYGFQIADRSIGRSAGTWRLLANATPGAPNGGAVALGSLANLRLNEWMALPSDGDDWFELYNLDSRPIDLGGLFVSDDPSLAGRTRFQAAPLSFIAGRGWVKWVADGRTDLGCNHVSFVLDGQGEMLLLHDPQTNLIDAVAFGAQMVGVSEGRLPDGGARVVGFPGATTPEASNAQLASGVRVNEMLANATLPPGQRIELFNPTGTNQAVGGWFLTDDFTNPKKFRLPDGTVIPSAGFLVFNEADFNPTPGVPPSFSLRARGGEVYLFSGDADGNLTGYYNGCEYGATDEGVSVGRYLTSTGEEHLVAQRANTLAAANAGPRVGPVVISEIMYHPEGAATNGAGPEPFLELKNLASTNLPLTDPIFASNTWRLAGTVAFAFPSNVVLSANGLALVVAFDPRDALALAEFRARYAVPTNVPVFGPYAGTLDAGGGWVDLVKPGRPEADGVPGIVVERVRYGTTLPWPPGADGAGASLHRLDLTAYGDDPTNWVAALPSPGALLGNGSPPRLTTQPEGHSVVAYTDSSFTAAAEGEAPLGWQWLFNGALLPGATHPTLELTNVQPSQAGTYAVMAFNRAGSVCSTTAVLTIILPATITEQPQSLNVNPGTNVTFRVGASGNGPLAFQWRFNGTNLPGATNSSLTLTNVQLANAGPYTVVVTDSIGSMTSEPAVLNLLVKPFLTRQAASLTVPVGATASLGVEVYGATPMGFRWLRNGTTCVPFEQGGATLQFTNVQLTNWGTYRVAVTNVAAPNPGTASTNMYLTVVEPPASQTVSAGAEVTLRAVVSGPITGSTPIRYQWQRHGVNLPGATGTNLVLSNVQPAQSGDYAFIVTNTVGVPAAFSARLTVLSPWVAPTIKASPSNLVTRIGETGVLVVVADGSEPLAYQWWFQETNAVPDGTNATLVLPHLQPAQEGAYHAVVSNPAGTALSATAWLWFETTDSDRDGMPDWQEALAGTDPHDGNSRLRVFWAPRDRATSPLVLGFEAVSNRTYALQASGAVGTASWWACTNFAAAPSNRWLQLSVPITVPRQQFFRVVTP